MIRDFGKKKLEQKSVFLSLKPIKARIENSNVLCAAFF